MRGIDGFTHGKDDEPHRLLTELLAAGFPAHEEYEDFDWAATVEGEAVLDAQREPMVNAVAERLRTIWELPEYSSTTVWASYDDYPWFHHAGLLREVLKRLLRKKTVFRWTTLHGLLILAREDARLPRLTVVGHVERFAKEQRLSAEQREALKFFRKRVWDDAVKKRVTAVLTGQPARPKRAAVLLGGEPWADIALARIAEDDTHWQPLLNHCQKLGSAQPGTRWLSKARKLAAAASEDYAATLVEWLQALPALDDEEDSEGRESARLFDQGNAVLLRGLIWAVPDPNDVLIEPAHDAALACYTKVPGHGPRSVVVGNACASLLAEIGSDDAVRALFDVQYNIDYSSVLNVLDRLLEEIAMARESSVPELEVKLNAREASLARRSLPELDDDSQLLVQIYRNPSDDDVRRVYADHLSERGDPLGELIVLQMLDEPTRQQRGRERALIRANREVWLGDLQPVIMKSGLVFRRGFPAEATIDGGQTAELHRLTGHEAWSTFESLRINGRDVEAPTSLLTHDVMRRALRSLCGMTIDNLLAFCKDREPWQLTEVGLGWHVANYVGEAARKILGEARSLPHVTRLSFHGLQTSPDQLEWWLRSKLFRRIRSLYMEPWGVGENAAFLELAWRLIEKLDRVELDEDGNWRFRLVREGRNIRLALRYRFTWGHGNEFERLRDRLERLPLDDLREVTVSAPSGLRRSAKDLAPLQDLLENLELDRFRLPKPNLDG